MQLVEELLESDSLETPGNINNNTLYVSLLADQGGTSTKLLLQVLNTKDSIIHGNRAAKMIGICEGGKESRECIDAIFSGYLLNFFVKMCDKMAISAYILKIVEKDPFLRLQMRAKEMFKRDQFFSTNKQYVKIKLMQNETNLWSIFW